MMSMVWIRMNKLLYPRIYYTHAKHLCIHCSCSIYIYTLGILYSIYLGIPHISNMRELVFEFVSNLMWKTNHKISIFQTYVDVP